MAVGGYGAPLSPGASPMPGSLAAFPRPMDPFSALLSRLGIGGGGMVGGIHYFGPGGHGVYNPGPRPVDQGYGPGGRVGGGPVRAPEVGVPAPAPSPATVSDFQHVLSGLQPEQNRFSQAIGLHRAEGNISENPSPFQPGGPSPGHLGGEHPVATLLRFLRMYGHPESASSMHVHQRNKDLLSHQARIQGL